MRSKDTKENFLVALQMQLESKNSSLQTGQLSTLSRKTQEMRLSQLLFCQTGVMERPWG
jgi:hypothetical protein